MSHNLTDREIFNKISEVDVVIHLAGKAHNIKNLNASEQSYVDANSNYACKIAQIASKKGMVRFVFVSSASVYGIHHSKEAINENTETQTRDFYGQSKEERR